MTTFIKPFLVYIIQFYRSYVSPFLPPQCRYYPSCSKYALLCLERFTIPVALVKISKRILKCNPLFPGGEDQP